MAIYIFFKEKCPEINVFLVLRKNLAIFYIKSVWDLRSTKKFTSMGTILSIKHNKNCKL